MSKTDYFQKDIPLTEEQAERTPSLDGNHGTPVLRVHIYYMKDARRRGLKLSINRATVQNTGSFQSFQFMPMDDCNGLMHLADLDRKNDKIGKSWAAVVEKNIDRIAEIALASEAPDWQEILHLVHSAHEPA